MGSYPTATRLTINASDYPKRPDNLYREAGQILFTNLWGASTYTVTTGTLRKPYLDIPKQMVGTDRTPNYLIDPWGNPYGYYWSGNNSLFSGAAPDIWSTGGGINAAARGKWIANWD